MCSSFLQEVYPTEAATKSSRTAFLELVRANESGEGTHFHETREKWEQYPRRGRRGLGKADKEVAVEESEGQSRRCCLGVFWPKAIYTQHFHQAIPRRKRRVQDGVSGAVLPSDATDKIPDGCWQIWATKDSKVTKTTHLVQEELRDDHAEGVYKAAVSAARLQKKTSGGFVSLSSAQSSNASFDVLHGIDFSGGLACALSDSDDDDDVNHSDVGKKAASC